MKFFWPTNKNNWKDTIESVVAHPSLTPFHSEVMSFLQHISKSILKDHSYRKFPELISLAYWLRKTHLAEMQEKFFNYVSGKVILARGTALHFAPSNVDTIFVYSWVLSMLSGNSNILRISGRKQEQTEMLLNIVINGLENFPEVSKRTVIITYDHNNETTQFLSERCQIRVIWGGDETVKAIRNIPLSPLATELAFPNRFSLSVLDAKTVMETNESELNNLIHHFYNDSFWFAQMACSSPRLIVWVGKQEKIVQAKDRFWESLNQYLNHQAEELLPALQVQKLSTGYLLSTKKNVETFKQLPNFSRLGVKEVDLEMRERHCGGGLFIELEISNLQDLAKFLHDKDQTLTYFGFTQEQLIGFAQNLTNRSIDRIVPVGQALDFEGIWDGYDLIINFTREIVIR